MKKFKLEIPAEKDWDDWTDDPPRDCVSEWNRGFAKQKFSGKSIEEVIPKLKSDMIIYYEEFCDMPRKCFQYYIFAITETLRNCSKTEAIEIYTISDVASCFFSIIKVRAEQDPRGLKPIMKFLWPDLVYVANNQEHFSASLEIYGDFRDHLAEIKKLCDENKITYRGFFCFNSSGTTKRKVLSSSWITPSELRATSSSHSVVTDNVSSSVLEDFCMFFTCADFLFLLSNISRV